jgi:predicted MFS family arabinose efflux permease
VWAGFAGAGGAIGPIVSGALLERFWWGAAVLVNLPVIAVTFVAISRFAPESRDDSQSPLDPVGALLSLVGLGALVYAVIQGGEKGWSTGPVFGAAVLSVVAIAAFVRWELHSDHPMLPLEFFRDRRFTTGSAVMALSFFVLLGFFFLVTQYLQFARGYSPLDAGLALLPLPIVFVAVSPSSAALAARLGPARIIAAGLVIVAAGFVLLSRLTPETAYPSFAAALAVLGAGMGVTSAPATAEIMSAVPLTKAGVGSAVNDTTRELGSALGIAVLGSIANSAYRGSITLTGLGLTAGDRAQVHESIGGAARVAAGVPRGAEVTARAASAFTDAFTRASVVSVVISLAAAVGVLWFNRRAREAQGEDAGEVELELALVPVPVPERAE